MDGKVCIIWRYLCHDKEAYVISYHGALCHDMSYVTTIMTSLPQSRIPSSSIGVLCYVGHYQDMVTGLVVYML